MPDRVWAMASLAMDEYMSISFSQKVIRRFVFVPVIMVGFIRSVEGTVTVGKVGG